ncbi:FMN-binding protein [Vallitalea maricola]|uniref:FMN-binding protein n=1 Tax=Vallitalea maricola TaxID=3074433 RepID=A0ACB5UDT6_9FIRM|nr:FMN-binding protein [Vallitalea sp. AN17-2]
MKKLKKRSKVFLIILGILVIAFFAVKSIHVKEIEVSNIDLNTLEDGIYKGSHDSTLVKAWVSVEIKNHTIKTIIIDEHQTGLGKKAETITDKIIEKQSLQVDGITGATVSSNTIKKAIEDALSKGSQ